MLFRSKTSDKGKDLIANFEDQFKKTVLVKQIKFDSVPAGHEIKINNLSFTINVKRLTPNA